MDVLRGLLSREYSSAMSEGRSERNLLKRRVQKIIASLREMTNPRARMRKWGDSRCRPMVVDRLSMALGGWGC